MQMTFRVIAIIQAILGGVLLGGGVVMGIALFFQKMDFSWSMLVAVLLAVFIGILGGVILAGALRHIRTPKKSNARDIASTTAVLIWMFVTSPMLRDYKMGTDTFGRASEMLPFLASIGIPYLLYRFVLKKMAERAFPDKITVRADMS